ncbi:MAG: cytochrome P450 [Legionella sp.]
MYLTWIVSPLIDVYYGAKKLVDSTASTLVALGRSYLFGDFPELVWHGFNRDWILEECYRRMKQSPDGVGQLIVGPYSAQNWRLVTLVMAPVPIVANYGENPVDPVARAPFHVMEHAIKTKTVINLSGAEASAERRQIKPYLSSAQRVSAKTLKLTQRQLQHWDHAIDFESQISLVCTNIIASTVFGLAPVSIEDIPILKEMSDKLVLSTPYKADFEQASRALLDLSSRIITASTNKLLNKPNYVVNQISDDPTGMELSNLPEAERNALLQNTHGGAALIVESNLSVLCTIALAKIMEQPGIRDKLTKELDTVDDLNDFNALDKLTYLQAIYTEALRFTSPTAVITRQTGVNATLKRVIGNDGESRDIAVPKGSYLFASIRREHFDSDYWTSPEQFMPERFDKSQPPRFSGPHFFPFSADVRSCPAGGLFVAVVFKTLIAFAVKNYNLRLNEPTEDIAIDSLHPRWTKKYYITDLDERAIPSRSANAR